MSDRMAPAALAFALASSSPAEEDERDDDGGSVEVGVAALPREAPPVAVTAML